MNTAFDRLTTLTVSDVMSKDVVQISAHQSMSEAAASMLQMDISGVIVVNEEGRCVGVLSAADFVRREYRDGRSSEDSFDPGGHELTRSGMAGSLEISDTRHEQVGANMSSAVQSIRADSSLLSAAKMMVLEHVHRLPVLDGGGYPVGLLTSTDILAAVVNAHQEIQQERSLR